MTALTRYFFDTVYFPRGAWPVVRWWEARRGVYNLAVGSAGFLSLGAAVLVEGLPPIGAVGAMVAIYGLAANMCYSLGAVADLMARRFGGPDFAPVGPALLRYGFVFSVGVTLLPIPMLVISGAFRLLALLLR